MGQILLCPYIAGPWHPHMHVSSALTHVLILTPPSSPSRSLSRVQLHCHQTMCDLSVQGEPRCSPWKLSWCYCCFSFSLSLHKYHDSMYHISLEYKLYIPLSSACASSDSKHRNIGIYIKYTTIDQYGDRIEYILTVSQRSKSCKLISSSISAISSHILPNLAFWDGKCHIWPGL